MLGLVVARLSEDFIAETTGTLPQNVNYALSKASSPPSCAATASAAGAGGLAGFDLDEGVPDGFDAAVVPIVCE